MARAPGHADGSCATRPGAAADALALHQARALDAPLPTPHSTDAGEIAVLEDDGSFFYRDKDDRPRVDMASVGRAFYRTHGDDYDALAVYLASGLDHWLGSPGALASAFVVRNAVEGIGLETFDLGVGFGSPARLEIVLSMNGLHRYPADPDANIGTDEYSTLDVLAHELGHRWCAYVAVDSAGFSVPALLGRAEQHWSFFLETGASFMDGNAWASPAPDSFRTEGSTARFSALDQYLMGLRPAAEVPPFFTVNEPLSFSPPGTYLPWTSPTTGVSCRGRATGWTVSDIVAVHGARVPDAAAAPHDFRMALVLLVPRGQAGAAADLAKLEQIRSRFSAFFAAAVEGRGSLDVTLDSRAGRVAIAHEPLSDTTDEEAPRPLAARVTIEQAGIPLGLDPASVRVHARVGSSGPFTAIPMTPSGADSFVATLPPVPGGGTVEYYLQAASDSAGVESFEPAGGPALPHAYLVGPDTSPPRIAHVRVATQAAARLPERLLAVVRDNVAVDSVWARHGEGLAQRTAATPAGRDSFVVWLGAGLAEGQTLPYRFEARDAAGNLAVTPEESPHMLRAGRDWTFDFENGAAAFAHGPWWYSYRDAWHLSHEESFPEPEGPGTAWKCGADGGIEYPPHLDAVLELPWLPAVEPGTALRFAHRYGLEARDPTFAWDGARIEAQVGAGPWVPLVPDDGYSHQFLSNSNPFQSGSPCWSGSSGGWRDVRVDLSGLAPGPARVRFRMLADERVGGEGWFVDHVRVDLPGDVAGAGLPLAHAPGAPWPNPARGTLSCRLPVLPAGAEVVWTLVDLAGRRVATLWRGRGATALEISGSTGGVPAGLYFTRLAAGGRTLATARVALVR
jgi:hypothetical protein